MRGTKLSVESIGPLGDNGVIGGPQDLYYGLWEGTILCGGFAVGGPTAENGWEMLH